MPGAKLHNKILPIVLIVTAENTFVLLSRTGHRIHLTADPFPPLSVHFQAQVKEIVPTFTSPRWLGAYVDEGAPSPLKKKLPTYFQKFYCDCSWFLKRKQW